MRRDFRGIATGAWSQDPDAWSTLQMTAMRNEDDHGSSGQPFAADADSGRLTAFNAYRGLLFSIAYRMVGSVTDAEDLLQETFIRWQQAVDTDIKSSKAFLITIVSRF